MLIKLLSKTVSGLLLCSLTLVVYAAPDLVVGTASGKSGDTVSLPITFSNNKTDDIVSMDFKLKYDPEKLSVEAVDLTELKGNLSNYSDDTKKGVITFLIAKFPLEAISSGNMEVKFTIKTNIKAGSVVALSLQDVTFSDNTAKRIIQDKITDGSVTVTNDAKGAMVSPILNLLVSDDA